MTKQLEELRESCLQSVAQKPAHLVTLGMNAKFWKKTKSHPLLNTVPQVNMILDLFLNFVFIISVHFLFI